MSISIGVGLPSAAPGVTGDEILEWARRADAGPFSSLGVTDRLVDPTYEALATLAAAAGVTKRIQLVSAVLLAPLHNGAVLAKQAATVDALSGGRLTLGLGVGIRDDDYHAAKLSFPARGKRFEEQLEMMRRIWAGDALGDGIGPIGPRPARVGGPELLIGARAPKAVRRVGQWADGYIAARESPALAEEHYRDAEDAWRSEGKPGKPRFVMVTFFSLADPERAAEWIKTYYAFRGSLADQIARENLTTPDAIKGAIRDFESIGVDEMIFLPCTPEIEQLDKLADVIA